jgi:Zn2+/Cd2+-exporting ATPase
VVILVTVGLVVGALLQWVPEEPSPWRWAAFALVYVAGGILLIFLFSLSNTLEAYAMGRTRQAIQRLVDLSPPEATLVDDAGREAGRIPVERAAARGSASWCAPASGSPPTARSRRGGATWTSRPSPASRCRCRRRTGDEVYAGTINQGGSWWCGHPRAGETMLARIVRLVEEAREQRAPAQHFIDRFAHPYTLGVVAATALVAVVPPLLLGRRGGTRSTGP